MDSQILVICGDCDMKVNYDVIYRYVIFQMLRNVTIRSIFDNVIQMMSSSQVLKFSGKKSNHFMKKFTPTFVSNYANNMEMI